MHAGKGGVGVWAKKVKQGFVDGKPKLASTDPVKTRLLGVQCKTG